MVCVNCLKVLTKKPYLFYFEVSSLLSHYIVFNFSYNFPSLSSSLMASSSSVTSRSYRFDVLLNFHGPDVPKTLLSHLRKQFIYNGISMFTVQDIERSQMIASSLREAIRESRISIVVLSKNYASSSWCLDELVEILKCKDDDMGKIVMTIFYGVDSSDMRKQTGDIWKVFKKTCACKTEKERQRWSQALKYVGSIPGEDFLRWDNEAHMVEKIAKDVSDKLNATASRDSSDMDFPSTEEEALVKSLEALEMELQVLNAMRNEVLRRVYKEEERGLQVLLEVKKWISDVEEIESEANPLLDKSISELYKLSEDCSPTNHYSEKVRRMLEEVKTLTKKEFSELAVDRAPLLHAKKMLPLQPTLDKTTLETKCLNLEESWDLFQEVVGETTLTSHPNIPQLARIVARKCGGFSFALYLIGVTMSSKRTAREWYHAIHVLVSSAADFSDTKDKILPILKLSYDCLPGENIRSCFLYCALFPEGDVTSKQGLVDCLIGEGIVAEEEDREIAEIKGYKMVGDLVRMLLLMEDESGFGVKMHDVVREMALWIASDFRKQKENFVVVSGERIHQMPEVNDWRMVRRMSVTSTQIESITDSPDCSQLITLFLKGNTNLKWISGDFFRWMTSLLLLDLSYNSDLAELPEEVSCLVSLRFLNLSFSSIKRLPLGLKELTRLIHLDLDNTHELRDINVITSLSNLQVLRLFCSVPMDLILMEDIKLLKSLKELSLTVEEDAVLQQLLRIYGLASCIRRLSLNGFTITDGGILLLNSVPSIRELSISGCNLPKITTDRRSAAPFSNIEQIPQFRNIHTVKLYRCKGVRNLTWLLLAPNLDNLSLCECPQIEEVISKDKATAKLGDTSEQPFQNLTSLILEGLPELKSIYWNPLPFPVLKYIQISRCPKLRSRPVYSDIAKGIIWDLEEEAVEPPRCHEQRLIPAVGAVEHRRLSQTAVEPPHWHDQRLVPVVEDVEYRRRSQTAVEPPRWHDQRLVPAVGAVENRHRSQTAYHAPPARRAGHAPAQRTDTVKVEERQHRRYVVGIEQLEDALAEHRVLKGKLEAMVSKELKAGVRFEQVKSQLRRAGRTFAQGLLPFDQSDRHPDQHYPDQRAIVPAGHGTRREATVPVRVDELQAALVRLSITKSDLEKVTSRERELRINIKQAEEQLLRAGITPSQGLLPSTAPTTQRSSSHRSSR